MICGVGDKLYFCFMFCCCCFFVCFASLNGLFSTLGSKMDAQATLSELLPARTKGMCPFPLSTSFKGYTWPFGLHLIDQNLIERPNQASEGNVKCASDRGGGWLCDESKVMVLLLKVRQYIGKQLSSIHKYYYILKTKFLFSLLRWRLFPKTCYLHMICIFPYSICHYCCVILIAVYTKIDWCLKND